MTEGCKYCGAKRVVPVLDKRIERSPAGGGNKYRQRCLGCSRWLPMTSEEAFRNHEDPHVLPADADPDDDGSVVPLHEYDYSDEWADLAQRVSPGQAALADGGVVEQEPDDDEETEPENEFDCPECGRHVEGYPDECPHDGCGVPYTWD